MKRILTLLAAAAALPLAATAQSHPGGVVFSGAKSTGHGGVYVADRTTGAWSTLFAPNATYHPGGWTQAVMDCDNRSYVHGTFGGNASFGLQNHGFFRYDPATGNVTTIVQNASIFSLSGSAAAGINVTQDGDYLLTGNAGLYRADGSGSLRTIVAAPSGFPGQLFVSDLTKDVTTGRVLFTGLPAFPIGSGTIYAMDTDETITTVHSVPLSPFPPTNWVQQLATGDFIGTAPSGLSTPSALFRFDSSTSPTQLSTLDFGPNTGLGGSSGAGRCFFENQSTSNPQLIVYGTKWDSSGAITAKLEFLDPQNSWAVTNTIPIASGNPTLSEPTHDSGAGFNDRSNYIQTAKTGVCTWDIKLSAPTFGGKSYALVAGASGIRPGIAIDSRRIWLNPDILAWATAYNLITQVFDPGPMILDANGEATGSIDLSGLNLPGGTRILTHMVLLVLDKNAPSGIAFITEPECFKILK